MGNCICLQVKAYASSPAQPLPSELQQMIRVVTSTGGIMELYAPITADSITDEFPGHRLFRSPDLFSSPPLLHNEHLHPGDLYYLLPISATSTTSSSSKAASSSADDHHPIRSSSSPRLTPYRMSFDHNQWLSKRSDPDVYPRYSGTGVWKVRLVINPEQLSEILSQEARTQELIESVRTVAKCGAGSFPPSSAASSDYGSVAGSWKPFSDKYDLDD
ncbi:hypothetical protein Dimus_025398 [Dionaea muscipula]